MRSDVDGRGSRAVLRTDGGSEQEDGEGGESDVRLQIHSEEKRRNATGGSANRQRHSARGSEESSSCK